MGAAISLVSTAHEGIPNGGSKNIFICLRDHSQETADILEDSPGFVLLS